MRPAFAALRSPAGAESEKALRYTIEKKKSSALYISSHAVSKIARREPITNIFQQK